MTKVCAPLMITKIFQAYYGGEARCDEQAAGGDVYDPTELVCGGCSDVSMAQVCCFLDYRKYKYESITPVFKHSRS